MPRGLREQAAAKCAEAVLRDHEVNELPVSPQGIAEADGISVQPIQGTRGVSGVLMRVDSEFAIAYSTFLDNPGFQRFSIAHELGHYFLPGHPEALLINGPHQSAAGFVSKDRFELEADHFAASLLMPEHLFDRALEESENGLGGIEALAGRCRTSMTATAIRYAQRTPESTAVVMSTSGRVDYCFLSDSFREIPGLKWLMKGESVPPGSLTRDFNQDPQNVANARREEDSVDLGDWFDCELNAELYEEVVGLGGYGKTLTVLTAEELPDPEELEEERRLVESWTPRHRRR